MQGFVSCNCFWARLAKPHPHPASIQQPAPGVLALDPKASPKVQEDHEEWLYDACSHPFMQVAWEDLGERDEKPMLLAALRNAGGKLPLISAISEAEEPPAPWSPEQVLAAAAELEWMRRELPPFPVHEVRDAASGEVIADTVDNEVHVTTGEGLQLGFDARGIWMTRRGTSVFTTRLLEQEEQPDGTYRLTPEGGAPVTISAAFTPYEAENPERHRPTPRRVTHATVTRPVQTVERHLEPLDKLLRAGRKLKHSIVWIP